MEKLRIQTRECTSHHPHVFEFGNPPSLLGRRVRRNRHPRECDQERIPGTTYSHPGTCTSSTQLVYRRASATWEEPMWDDRTKVLQDGQYRGESFSVRFRSELLQLTRDINARYNNSLSIGEVVFILDFVHQRHGILHAGFTKPIPSRGFSPSSLLRGFFNYHPELSREFASGLCRRRAHSCKPEPIRESWNRSKVMEDMFGALRLVSC